MMRRSLQPPDHTPPIGAYSAGLAVDLAVGDRLVGISGQVASDETGAVVGAGDPAAQAEFVFGRIAAVLAEAGGALPDLVAVTIYVVDMAHFPLISAVRNRWLGEARPASTLVQVSRLALPEHLVEVCGFAVVKGARP